MNSANYSVRNTEKSTAKISTKLFVPVLAPLQLFTAFCNMSYYRLTANNFFRHFFSWRQFISFHAILYQADVGPIDLSSEHYELKVPQCHTDGRKHWDRQAINLAPVWKWEVSCLRTARNHNVYMGGTDRQTDRQTGRQADRQAGSWVGMPSALEYLMLSLDVWADGGTCISLSHIRCCTVGWSCVMSSSLDCANCCHISLNSHSTSSVWLAQILNRLWNMLSLDAWRLNRMLLSFL